MKIKKGQKILGNYSLVYHFITAILKSQNSVPIQSQHFIDSLTGLLKSGIGNAFTSHALFIRDRNDAILSRCDSRELITLLSPSHCNDHQWSQNGCNKLSYMQSNLRNRPPKIRRICGCLRKAWWSPYTSTSWRECVDAMFRLQYM